MMAGQHLGLAIAFIYVCLGLIGIGMLLLFYMKIRHLRIQRKTKGIPAEASGLLPVPPSHLAIPRSFRCRPASSGIWNGG
ncbi:hypothetical protein HMSSN139_04240 [Paenibacillus sp. HMSSN-139]|nr:hypothetical protein HMSSN139_04240 [Paenibacillus sp. HMSSN-139]